LFVVVIDVAEVAVVVIVILVLVRFVVVVAVVVTIDLMIVVIVTPLHCVFNIGSMQVLLNVVHLQCKHPRPLCKGSLQ